MDNTDGMLAVADRWPYMVVNLRIHVVASGATTFGVIAEAMRTCGMRLVTGIGDLRVAAGWRVRLPMLDGGGAYFDSAVDGSPQTLHTPLPPLFPEWVDAAHARGGRCGVYLTVNSHWPRDIPPGRGPGKPFFTHLTRIAGRGELLGVGARVITAGEQMDNDNRGNKPA